MNLQVHVKHLKAFKSPVIDDIVSYHSNDQIVTVGADLFTSTQLDKIAKDAKGANDAGSRTLCRRIASYQSVLKNPTEAKIGTLELLAVALREYIAPSPNKWLFESMPDGYLLPHFVVSIDFHARRDHRPANVQISLENVIRGKKSSDSIVFDADELRRPVTQLLAEKGYFLETEQMVAAYREDVEAYKAIVSKTGAVFSCAGSGFDMDGRVSSQVAMVRDGEQATVVLDDTSEDGDRRDRSFRESSNTTSSLHYWTKKPGKEKAAQNDDEEEDHAVVATPVHPYIKVFDLQRHLFVQAHVRNLTPYIFDATAADKLVLSDKMRDLVDALVHHSNDVREDIVRGKTGGSIVITTGPPGTGKTLTAQVVAEKTERPLYVVQCSQLGTDETNIEKNLLLVLTRAIRWNAVLLIDEADVYVHERGTNIRQNAIVGVFLRILEGYRGFLFLTSNRETIIDDAILSRATAWLRYELPTKDQLKQLWRIHSKQQAVSIDDATIEQLLGEFEGISGRTVKNMLKLARLVLQSDKKWASNHVGLLKHVWEFTARKVDER